MIIIGLWAILDRRKITPKISGGVKNGARTTTDSGNSIPAGVENAGQLAYLKASGCTEGQGYLFSKAVPASDIPELINRAANLSSAA